MDHYSITGLPNKPTDRTVLGFCVVFGGWGGLGVVDVPLFR